VPVWVFSIRDSYASISLSQYLVNPYAGFSSIINAILEVIAYRDERVSSAISFRSRRKKKTVPGFVSQGDRESEGRVRGAFREFEPIVGMVSVSTSNPFINKNAKDYSEHLIIKDITSHTMVITVTTSPLPPYFPL
jgi:hypothetical protein